MPAKPRQVAAHEHPKRPLQLVMLALQHGVAQLQRDAVGLDLVHMLLSVVQAGGCLCVVCGSPCEVCGSLCKVCGSLCEVGLRLRALALRL